MLSKELDDQTIHNIHEKLFNVLAEYKLGPDMELALLYDQIRLVFKTVLHISPTEYTINKLMKTNDKVNELLEEYMIKELKEIRTEKER